jgi:hypothetical protein
MSPKSKNSVLLSGVLIILPSIHKKLRRTPSPHHLIYHIKNIKAIPIPKKVKISGHVLIRLLLESEGLYFLMYYSSGVSGGSGEEPS